MLMCHPPHPSWAIHRGLEGLRGVSQPFLRLGIGRVAAEVGHGCWINWMTGPDGAREPRYHDEVILVGVPAAQPFRDLRLAAGGSDRLRAD